MGRPVVQKYCRTKGTPSTHLHFCLQRSICCYSSQTQCQFLHLKWWHFKHRDDRSYRLSEAGSMDQLVCFLKAGDQCPLCLSKLPVFNFLLGSQNPLPPPQLLKVSESLRLTLSSTVTPGAGGSLKPFPEASLLAGRVLHSGLLLPHVALCFPILQSWQREKWKRLRNVTHPLFRIRNMFFLKDKSLSLPAGLSATRYITSRFTITDSND